MRKHAGEVATTVRIRYRPEAIDIEVLNARGRAKVELALAKGKKTHDKRETIKERDWKREQQRLMKSNG